MQAGGRLPRIVWLLWLQGWQSAPPVAKASLASWKRFNPDWRVNALDSQTLSRFIPPADLDWILRTEKEPEALSDQIRMELLHRYGGVWADATTICGKGLDDWLNEVMFSGFFAFSNPGAHGMLATWFLAAEKGSCIVEKWREKVAEYWTGRTFRDDYFWVHKLFGEAYESDRAFRAAWDATPKRAATNPFHFNPDSPELLEPPSTYYREALSDPPVPVFKLTHKLGRPFGGGSLMGLLSDFGHGGGLLSAPPEKLRPKSVLVGWYGSFPGHGTIGDLRSLESAVSHLVGRGHMVKHATAAAGEIPGAGRVDWRTVDPAEFDGVLFVCGPILKNHPETRAFFDRFSEKNLAGLGVSLLPKGHPNSHDPFTTVFARQGGAEDFGDVAIAAAQDARHVKQVNPGPVIGVALRGAQNEYGTDLCKWQETETLVNEIVLGLTAGTDGRVLPIENHLERSGLSPREIEEQYEACDLVLTSRFHGAIIALRRDKPFIALDQIAGGAKVYDLLIGLGWPHVYKIDDVPPAAALIQAAKELLHGEGWTSLNRARNKAVSEANRTLCHLDIWIDSL